MKSERPYVGTGIEGRLARDSRVLMMATHPGIVAYVSANKVIVSLMESYPQRKMILQFKNMN